MRKKTRGSLIIPDSTLTLETLSPSWGQMQDSAWPPAGVTHRMAVAALCSRGLTGSCELPPRAVHKEAGMGTSARRLQGELLGCQSRPWLASKPARQQAHIKMCHSTDPKTHPHRVHPSTNQELWSFRVHEWLPRSGSESEGWEGELWVGRRGCALIP